MPDDAHGSRELHAAGHRPEVIRIRGAMRAALSRNGRWALSRDTLANFLGQGWSRLLAIVAIPLYRHYLGTEAYGLIAFLVSVQALAFVLDFGWAVSANREIVRLANSDGAGRCRAVVRAFEAAYWASGAAIGLALILGSGWIATGWLRTQDLGIDEVSTVLQLFGVLLALRWPVSLYRSVLSALERQVATNCVLCVTTSLGYFGALAVIVLVSPTVSAFMTWQVAIQVVEVAALRLLVGASLPATRSASASPLVPAGLWRFAVGATGVSVLWTILAQIDKTLVATMLPLEDLGYYGLAAALAGGIQLCYSPIFDAVLPRFSRWYASGDRERLVRHYHEASRVVAWVVSPVAGLLIFFPREVLLLWTRSEPVAQHASVPLSLLAGGHLMVALMAMPYALQLAAGLIRIQLFMNLVSVLVLVPLILTAVTFWGIAGGAVGWLTVGVLQWLVIPHILHGAVLPGEKMSWLVRDTLPFVAGSFGLFLMLDYGIEFRSSSQRVLLLAGAAVAFYAAALWLVTGFRRRGWFWSGDG